MPSGFCFAAPLRWFEEELGRCGFLLRRQAQDARHHGRHEPEGQLCCEEAGSLPTSAAACAWQVTIFHAVFTCVLDMLKMLDILVGMGQKDRRSLVVFFWLWHVHGWFA